VIPGEIRASPLRGRECDGMPRLWVRRAWLAPLWLAAVLGIAACGMVEPYRGPQTFGNMSGGGGGGP
jgi:hypothetical protein